MTNRYDEDEHLRLKLQFSNHDLEENRAGRLSENQKRRMIHEANKLLALYWIVFALMGGLVLAALVEMRSLLGSREAWVWLLLAMGAGFIGLYTTMLWWASDEQTRDEVRAGVVSMAEGRVTLITSTGGEGEPIYIVIIGHYAIEDVLPPTYQAFEDGQPYRVYFLRKRILSAEVLHPEPTSIEPQAMKRYNAPY
ncbi:MAG: hypothetical protein K8L97_07630 [Anaerolineae bacterium]|nr:hypothetical protein [Anaerolineae bacterium]